MSGNVAITEKGLQAFKEVTQLTSHVPSCIICLENVCTSIPAKQRQSVPLRGLESEGPSPTLCVHNQSPFILQVLKSHGQDYLVGNRLTRVDIHLLEVLLYVEEFDASLLTPFPLLKAFKSRISSLPNVKKFLQPGSQRKPPMDAKQIQEARKAFKIQ